MSPQEKAKELLDKMYSVKTMYDAHNITIHEAKQCTLIAIDEILKNGSLINQSELYKANKIKPTPIYKEYWKQVKKEIEKL